MYRQPTNKHRVLAMKDKFENKNCNNNVQNMCVKLSENNNIPQRVFLNNTNATTECTKSNIVPYLPKQISGSSKRIIKRSEAFRRDKNSSDSTSSFQRNLVLRTSCRTTNIDDKIKLFDSSNNNQPLQRSGSFSDLYSTPRRKTDVSKQIESNANSKTNEHNDTTKESRGASFNNTHFNGKSLQEAFKEALKKPLPSGPAPSKPPRTFLYTPNNKLNARLIKNTPKDVMSSKESPIKKEKSDPKYMLDKLETVLKNNRLKRQERIDISISDDYEAESNQFQMKEKKFEPIYDEPFHQNKIKSDSCNKNRNSLYYMFLGVFAVAIICWSLVCIIPFRELLGNGFTLPQIIFVVLAFFTLALTIMGIVGYQKRSLKLTLSFSVVLLLLSILFILVGVMITLELLKIKPVLQARLFRLYLAYNDSTDNDIYDAIQYQFECCGYNNYTDWYYNSSHAGHLSGLVPLSCCQATSSEGSKRHAVCRNAGINMDYLRTSGCYSRSFQVALSGALPVIIIAFIIAVTGVSCSAMSFKESKRIKNELWDSDDDEGLENEDDEGVED